MRTLFLGSGPFGIPTLERLAKRGSDLVVGTVPDAPKGRRGKLEPTVIKARALELGLPVHEVESLKGSKGPAFLAATGGDLVITCDFRLILGKKFLAAPPRGCFNLHGSLLPAYRGAAPVARGVLAGDREFGISLYRMVFALDAGPVVAMARYTPPEPLDTGTLEQILSERAGVLLEEWIEVLESGDVPLVEQDATIATFAPKLEKAEGWIDWRNDAASIERQVRGMKPWPRAFTHWGEEKTDEPVRVFIDRAVVPEESDLGAIPPAVTPGTVRRANAEGIDVACGDGTDTLRLLQLQRAGKKSLPAADFLRGFSVDGGRFLEPPPRPAAGGR